MCELFAMSSRIPAALSYSLDAFAKHGGLTYRNKSGWGDELTVKAVVSVNHTAQMYLNDEPAITAGREIWGFPNRWGQPKLRVATDTLTGTFEYAGQRVTLGTLGYKHENLCRPRKSAAEIWK